MKKKLIFVLLIILALQLSSREYVLLQQLEYGTANVLRMKGPYFSDFNRNGNDELLMWRAKYLRYLEYQYDYHFDLVKENIYDSYMWIAGTGDFDNDGLYEILGGDPDSQFIYLMEQTDSFNFPDSITWHSDTIWEHFYPLKVTKLLKSDSVDRITGIGIPGISTAVWGNGFYFFECTGDNSYTMNTFAESLRTSLSFDICDIDDDNLAEYFIKLIDGVNLVQYKATDAICDSFEIVDSIYNDNAINLLAFPDTDGDGKKELMQQKVNYSGGGISSFGFDLYEDDNSDGSLDSIWATDFEVTTPNDLMAGGDMDFGDIDGDGEQEIAICGGRHFEIWKSTANNTYTKIFEWTNPEYTTLESHIRCHDFNKNGIDEIIYSGTGTYIEDEATFIFECRPLAKLDYSTPVDMGNQPLSTTIQDSIWLSAIDELPVIIDSMKLKNGENISIIHPSYPCSIPSNDSIPVEFQIYSDTSTFITDSLILYSNDWFGNVDTVTIYSGVAAEITIDSAVASDNRNAQSGIDYDDYVKLYFNNPIIPPDTSIIDLDSILLLSLGHTWYDGTGNIRQITCVDNNSSMYVFFSTDAGIPTVSVGDTIYPDSLTITDNRGYTYLNKPVVITGSFGSSGIEENITEHNGNTISIKNNTIYYTVTSPNSSIIITDILGRVLYSDKKLNPGNYTYKTDMLNNGVYFIRISSDDFSETSKFQIIR